MMKLQRELGKPFVQHYLNKDNSNNLFVILKYHILIDYCENSDHSFQKCPKI